MQWVHVGQELLSYVDSNRRARSGAVQHEGQDRRHQGSLQVKVAGLHSAISVYNIDTRVTSRGLLH